MRKVYALIASIILTAILTACGGGGTTDQTIANAATAPTPSVTHVAEKKTELTPSQKNAMRSVETYTSFAGFSRKGLIKQLTQFDNYSKADATFAVDHSQINFNEQAETSAKNYLDFTGFSRAGLIKQLTDFDGYTEAEATYAADKVGL